MQNFEHLTDVFTVLNRVPIKQRGADFSRIKNVCYIISSLFYLLLFCLTSLIYDYDPPFIIDLTQSFTSISFTYASPSSSLPLFSSGTLMV